MQFCVHNESGLKPPEKTPIFHVAVVVVIYSINIVVIM